MSPVLEPGRHVEMVTDANGVLKINQPGGIQVAFNAAAQGSSLSGAGALQNTGSALSIDLTQGQFFRVQATADNTISFSNLYPGAEWTIEHRQDATGGRRTLFSGVQWVTVGGAVNPTQNALDIFTFICPDGSTIYGFQSTGTVFPTPIQNFVPGAVENMPRVLAGNARSVILGDVHCSHFVLSQDYSVSNIETLVTGTLGIGQTLAKVGISIVGGTPTNVTHTTIARSSSDTAMWTTATGPVTKPIVDDGQGNAISSVLLKAGVTYALLICNVGGSQAPQLGGHAGQGTGAELKPSLSGKGSRATSQIAGQTDIPASFTTGNTGAGSYYYALFWT